VAFTLKPQPTKPKLG
ncbi:hypothetical protein VCHC64A1_00507B, partial [Vibrio cholerae HC-64A1]